MDNVNLSNNNKVRLHERSVRFFHWCCWSFLFCFVLYQLTWAFFLFNITILMKMFWSISNDIVFSTKNITEEVQISGLCLCNNDHFCHCILLYQMYRPHLFHSKKKCSIIDIKFRIKDSKWSFNFVICTFESVSLDDAVGRSSSGL